MSTTCVNNTTCTLARCACRFALPALLPLISPDLQLTDNEGAMLTVGYTVRSTKVFVALPP